MQLDWYGDSVPAHYFSLPQNCPHVQLDQPAGALGARRSAARRRPRTIPADPRSSGDVAHARSTWTIELRSPSREFDGRERAPVSVSPCTERATPSPLPRVEWNRQPASAVSTYRSSEIRERSTPLSFAHLWQLYRVPVSALSEPTTCPSTAQPRRLALVGRTKAVTKGSTARPETTPLTDPRWTRNIEHRYTAVLRGSDGSDR